MAGWKKNDARAGARSLYMTAMVALGQAVAGSAVGGLAGELWVDGRSRARPTNPSHARHDQPGKGVKVPSCAVIDGDLAGP